MEIEGAQNKSRQLESDLEDCYLKMNEIKKIKDAIEEDFFELKIKEETHRSYL